MEKIKNILLLSYIPTFSYIYYQNSKFYNLTNKNYQYLLKEDLSSKTILSVSKNVTKKWDSNDINVYENEKKWLNILKDTDVIAKPINFDDSLRTITTEYVGKKVNKCNLPSDWEAQRDNIISVLEKNNCRHNDIKPDEIIVYDGKIKLVDFGWANELNKKNPDNWPKGLGSKFKCNKPNKDFDDKCSFNKSIFYIMNNALEK